MESSKEQFFTIWDTSRMLHIAVWDAVDIFQNYGSKKCIDKVRNYHYNDNLCISFTSIQKYLKYKKDINKNLKQTLKILNSINAKKGISTRENI